MAGILPDEGENLIANLIFKNADIDRGTDLELGLFTNTSVSETTTEATITEPSPAGGAYARITLADGSWTVTNGVASFAKQTFTATGGPYSAPVYGYFIATTGTTPRLLAVELDTAGPYSMAENDAYDITPSITLD